MGSSSTASVPAEGSLARKVSYEAPPGSPGRGSPASGVVTRHSVTSHIWGEDSTG